MRPLSDAAIAADVVDLVVRDADRAAGALAFLLCRPDATLAQPIVVGDLDGEDPVRVVEHMMTMLTHLPDTPGLVLAIARPSGLVRDADRRLHQQALELCDAHGLVLHGTFLATRAGVSTLPVAQGLRPRRGAA